MIRNKALLKFNFIWKLTRLSVLVYSGENVALIQLLQIAITAALVNFNFIK